MTQHTMKNAFSEHLFEYRSIEKKKLTLSLIITLVVMVVELIGGFLTHSIALISDASHMFTHSFAIGISLVAIEIARKPPCHHRTFGLYRAEILAAFVNGLFLLLVVAVIIYEAVARMIHPQEVVSLSMLMIGIIGLVVNIVSIIILHGSHREDLNVKSVFYHMTGDAISSVGIVIGAGIIYYTGWNIIDPLISLVISAIIIYWALGILRESTKILLEMAPTGLNSDTITADLKRQFPEIKELYNAHLWTITANMLVFSVHIRFDDTVSKLHEQHKVISEVNKYLAKKYHIIESTIQATSQEPLTCRPEE
jgi:cobalt-zinc-cadmium efflux system protein